MSVATFVKAHVPGPVISVVKRLLGRDYYDRLTQELIRIYLRPDSNATDIGANRGDILAMILARAPNGKHMAFEPLPELAGVLRKKFPDVDIRQIALSDGAGQTSFHRVIGHEAYSGFRRRPLPKKNWQTALIQVDRERLDALWPKHRPLNFVKIDVEGAQLEVLRGAIPLLERWKPIVVFEHGLGAMEVYGTTSDDVFDLLADCGLRVWPLDRNFMRGHALDKAAFAEQCDRRLNYNFVAGPGPE